MATIKDLTGFVPLSPDLVIEVVSPSDSSSAVEAKAQMWIATGARVCLVADPANETIRVYRSESSTITLLRSDDQLDVSDVVDGWTMDVSEAFL